MFLLGVRQWAAAVPTPLRTAGVVLTVVMGMGGLARLEAQQIDLSGSWSGPFEDEFHCSAKVEAQCPSIDQSQWRASADSSLHAVCRGTLRIQLHQADHALAGELAQDQRCRIGDGEWFEEPNEGWLIAGGSVDGYDVTFSTIQDGGIGLGTAFCRWTATFVLGMLRGRFDCTFSGNDGARASGRYEITRQPDVRDSRLDHTH